MRLFSLCSLFKGLVSGLMYGVCQPSRYHPVFCVKRRSQQTSRKRRPTHLLIGSERTEKCNAGLHKSSGKSALRGFCYTGLSTNTTSSYPTLSGCLLFCRLHLALCFFET